MTVIDFAPLVYIVLGIDGNQNDQVLAVCSCYEGAKRYCVDTLVQTEFFDVWIEKHIIQSYEGCQ